MGLASETMEEITYLITKLIKGDKFRKVYFTKLKLTPNMY